MTQCEDNEIKIPQVDDDELNDVGKMELAMN
jgi:hypothetical protein